MIKEKSLSVLMYELDDLVSEVIRRSCADGSGRCECISCGKKDRWQNMDLAHLFDRGNMGTRYDLRNLAPACRDCNRFQEDFHKEAWMDKVPGEVLSELSLKSKSTMKYMRCDLEEGIRLMKEKLKQLK